MSINTIESAEHIVDSYADRELAMALRAILRELSGETNHTIPMKNSIVSEYNSLADFVDTEGQLPRYEVHNGRIRENA